VIGLADLGKGRTENERIASEEGVCLLTLFLNKKQQEKFNININFKNKRTMNKRIFRKVRVIGDVAMCIEVACCAYRLIKNEICPWICKKIHKNKNAGAAEEVNDATDVLITCLEATLAVLKALKKLRGILGKKPRPP